MDIRFAENARQKYREIGGAKRRQDNREFIDV